MRAAIRRGIMAAAAGLLTAAASAHDGPGDEWRQYKADDGSYVFAMPGNPRQHAIVNRQDPNAALLFHTISYEHDGGSYALTYEQYRKALPEDAHARALDAMVEAMQARLGKVSGKKRFARGNVSGVEFTIALKDETTGKTRPTRMRMLLAGNRVYELSAAGVPAKTQTAFFDSLRLCAAEACDEAKTTYLPVSWIPSMVEPKGVCRYARESETTP